MLFAFKRKTSQLVEIHYLNRRNARMWQNFCLSYANYANKDFFCICFCIRSGFFCSAVTVLQKLQINARLLTPLVFLMYLSTGCHVSFKIKGFRRTYQAQFGSFLLADAWSCRVFARDDQLIKQIVEGVTCRFTKLVEHFSSRYRGYSAL